VGTSTTSYPAIEAVAGFVPCAPSGQMTTRRCSPSPRASWIRADHQDARELAVRAGGGLQADGVHAGDGGEVVLELGEDREHALRGALVLVRVDVLEALGDLFVDLRVVLHRARAERVDVAVDRELAVRELRVVPHQVELGDLGEPGRSSAQVLFAQQFRHRRPVHDGRPGGAAPGGGAFEDQREARVAEAVRGVDADRWVL
jgi:hypothetical protein